MARLIDVNDVYSLFKQNGIARLHVSDIDQIPIVDAVEVVRCRECKYRFGNNGHSKNGCPIIDANIWMDDDDFCSHGERKEGVE